jgi:aminopeptidase N
MRTGHSWLVALLVTAGSPAAAQSPLAIRHDAERPAHDATHYDIWIRLADSGSGFRAAVTTTWRLVGTGPLRINLDSNYRIGSLTVNGRPARYRRRAADLLSVTVPPGTTSPVTTRVEYQGAPPKFERPGRKSGQDDGLVQRGSGATRTIFADNWPDRARKWLASQDHPSDKATARWTIEAPNGLTVVANGTGQGTEQLADGLTRWRFSIDRPIPVYTMVLGAARLAETKLAPAQCAIRCVPVLVYTYPEDSAWATSGPFRRATEMIDFFSGLIAPYPYGELRHVETSTIFGGMENATVIFYDEEGYRARRLDEGTVAHETAHQWFGDSATERDWHHLWLSEGFATYSAALWDGHVGGDSAFRATMRDNRETVIRSAATERPIIDPAATDLLGLLNSNNYPKGAWVLHSLRGLIGDSAFFRGIRKYYRAHEHGTALSADLANVMSAEAGHDLTWYFTQALTQPGYPIIAVTGRLEGGHLVVELTQTQKPGWGRYRLPNLEIRLGGRTIKVALLGRTVRTVTHWEGATVPPIEVDPHGWWLLDVAKP